MWNRNSLKSFFRKGQLPNEMHFAYLIDSTVNKLDDGFSKTDLEGLRISPTGGSESVMSFFENATDEQPSWQINLKKNESGSSLSIDHIVEQEAGKTDTQPALFLGGSGNIGIGTSNPRTQLSVGGTFSTRTRTGAYAVGQVPGDGKWQDVLADIDHPQAFEVLARIDGAKNTGKYAFTHALAVSTYGGAHNTVRQTRAYYGWFFRRIEFRWAGEVHAYRLQVRTRSHYGYADEKTQTPFMIRFHITSLWDDAIFQL